MEKVIISQLKDDTLDDNPYIAQNHELMYIDSNDVAHCLLFVDYDSGDGVLVESEGSSYARKSQFIPNARALLESNELTAAETRLHEMIKEITANIAEKAHCGEKHFVLEDVMSEINSGDFRSNIMQAVGEMLRERDDIQSAEVINLNVHFQSRFEVKQSQHRN